MAYTNLVDMSTEEIVHLVRSRRLLENTLFQYNSRTKGKHKNIADALEEIKRIKLEIRGEARRRAEQYFNDNFFI